MPASLVTSVVSDSLKPPRTAALQAPLFMGFARQEYWSQLPCPPPEDFPNPGIKAASPVTLAWQEDSLPTEPPGKPSREKGIAFNRLSKEARAQENKNGWFWFSRQVIPRCWTRLYETVQGNKGEATRRNGNTSGGLRGAGSLERLLPSPPIRHRPLCPFETAHASLALRH